MCENKHTTKNTRVSEAIRKKAQSAQCRECQRTTLRPFSKYGSHARTGILLRTHESWKRFSERHRVPIAGSVKERHYALFRNMVVMQEQAYYKEHTILSCESLKGTECPLQGVSKNDTAPSSKYGSYAGASILQRTHKSRKRLSKRHRVSIVGSVEEQHYARFEIR